MGFWWAGSLQSHGPVSSSRLWAAAAGVFLCCSMKLVWRLPGLLVLSQLCPAALENGELVIPLHPAEVLSKGQLWYCNAVQRWEAGTSLRVPQLRKRLSSALWELGGTPSPNESWESGCVKSTCQGKPLTRPEWVSKRNFQALNSFPALTRVLLISALLYSFCHLTQSFHWLLCGCLEG